jgi:hypothetical protein
MQLFARSISLEAAIQPRASRRVPVGALCATSLVLVLGIQSAAAQRPNFSGRWALVPDSTAPARGTPPSGNPGSGWGTAFTITQDSAGLLLEQPFFSRYDMQPALRFLYALDGTETKNTVMAGHGFEEQRSRVTWNNSSLVITTTYRVGNPAGSGDSLRVEVTRTISLESPTRLLVETRRAGVLGGPSTTTRTAYTKQQ